MRTGEIKRRDSKACCDEILFNILLEAWNRLTLILCLCFLDCISLTIIFIF